MGWLVPPQHQRRGIAAAAAHLALSEARSSPGERYVHALPALGNAASSAIAREIGMENQGEFDNAGIAAVLFCNDWRIDLGVRAD